MTNSLPEYGAIHGRFQVFHNDHLAYALAASERCQQLIVGITSPDPVDNPSEPLDPHRADPEDNPLTYFDRVQMIQTCLREEGLHVAAVVPSLIGDPGRLQYYFPPGTVHMFTIYDAWGQEKVQRAESVGFETVVLWNDRPKGITGTRVRAAMKDGENWQSLVPPSVARFVKIPRIWAVLSR